jgi:hypothetical protein
MRVLIGCEYSGVIRDAFIARGHAAMSCDLLPTESPGPHYQGDLRDVLVPGWDLVILHPPCTYITNAGVRHLYEHIVSVNGRRAEVHGQKRRAELLRAVAFFMDCLVAPCERLCVENPIPSRHAAIPRYTQLIQPHMFGHPETKATCLWLKGLPDLIPTQQVLAGIKSTCHNMSPSPDRAKHRARTFQGIADAMADQWGSLT